MNKQFYIVIALVFVILGAVFYWYEIRPFLLKKDCFDSAEKAKQMVLSIENDVVTRGFEITKRADYDKIFDDEYNRCLIESGVNE